MRRLLSLLVCLAAGLPLPSLAQVKADLPTLPSRVVAGPFYNGRLEVVLDAAAGTYLALVDAERPRLHLEAHYLQRHRSLPIRNQDSTGGEAGLGLLDALEAQATATGWEPVPELSLDAGVLYEALALEREGHVILVLAYGDAMAPRADNPGVSLEIAAEAYDCLPGDELPATAGAAPDRAGCRLRGFVPVILWTNLPAEESAGEPWLDPNAPIPSSDSAIWSDLPTWEEVLSQADQG